MNKYTLLLLSCFTNIVFADNTCTTPKNDFDDLYCLNKIYLESDKELNKTYKNLNIKLNNSGKNLLKISQLSWLNQRNSSCSRNDSDGFFINMTCATNTTIERTHFLQDRLRECNSTGCLNDKLQ